MSLAQSTNWGHFPNRSVGFWWKEKTGEPGEKPSEQRREPTTNSTHIWRRVRESNPGHIGGRRVLSPLHHPCSPHVYVHVTLVEGTLNLIFELPKKKKPILIYLVSTETLKQWFSSLHRSEYWLCLAAPVRKKMDDDWQLKKIGQFFYQVLPICIEKITQNCQLFVPASLGNHSTNFFLVF